MLAIFLCGPPGAGKSTYVSEHLSDYIHLSKDAIIFREAQRLEKTYNEIFSDYSQTAYDILIEQIKGCVNKQFDFVLDMTNITEKSRKEKLNLLPSYVKKVAIYFPSYTPKVLKARIEKRGTHDVPMEAVTKFVEQYKLPQKTEGFDLVVSSSHFIDIMSVMDFK